MRVVIDTNVFVQDFFMSRPHFQILLREAARENLDLVLPKMVVEEAIAVFKRRLKEDLAKLDTVTRSLSRLHVPLSVETHPDQAALAYELNLRLQASAAEIADFPAVPHAEVVRRAIDRRKPFKEDGRGYRDTLLWYTVLEAAERGPTVLITANSRDFARDAEGNELHHQLVEDLARRGLEASQVALVPSVTAFVNANVQRAAHVEQELRDRLRDPEFRRHLAELLSSVVSPADVAHIRVPGVDHADVRRVEIQPFSIDGAREIDSDRFAVEITANVSTEISFSMSEEEEFFFQSGSYEIVERGVSGGAVTGRMMGGGSAEFEAIYHTPDGRLTDAHVIELAVE